MNNCHIESGIQFLTRVKSVKSNLRDLENNLFITCLKPTDIIELSSDSNFSKTQLLYNLIKNAVLINSHNGSLIGGLDTGVLFIDTEFHFQIQHVCQYLKNHIKNIDSNCFTTEDVNEIVEKSLKNLTIIRCYDSQQFLMTFHFLHSLLTSNPKIKFIILDSIGANYWQDSNNGGVKKMDTYEKKVLSVLTSCIRDFKLMILYVRPEFLVMKNPMSNLLADYKLRIRGKDETKNIFEVVVTSKNGVLLNSKSFTIHDGNFMWSG